MKEAAGVLMRGLIEMRDSLKNVSVFAPLVAACRSSLATGRSSAANGKYSIVVSVDLSFLPLCNVGYM